MSLPFLFPFALAVLNVRTPAPATPAPGTSPDEAPIHDITPPLDVFPYPPWVVVLAIFLVLVILGSAIWLIVWWARQRKGPPPPLPSEVALLQLERLRKYADDMEPYKFSIEVSDVLRTFIGKAKFQLPATTQTSPELLAAISKSPLFGEKDRTLLSRFAEKCDMIKFARIQATGADNVDLVESALAFVKGGHE